METLAEKWQQNLDQGILQLPQCDNCERWNWYPLPVCTGCGGTSFSWTNIPLEGSLFSWTRVHRNFTGMNLGPIPYTVGLIEMNAAPAARIPCRYVGSDANSLKMGNSVKLSFIVPDDQTVLGFNQ